MLYFDTLPKVLMRDQNGNRIILTNLMSRATILENLQNNSIVFYKYNIQEGDTPETVAHKYYGDPYKYWIVMYSNQLMDPLWDWPMNYQTFTDYIQTQPKMVNFIWACDRPLRIEHRAILTVTIRLSASTTSSRTSTTHCSTTNATSGSSSILHPFR